MVTDGPQRIGKLTDSNEKRCHSSHRRGNAMASLDSPDLFPGTGWSQSDMRRLFVDGGLTRPLASFADALLKEVDTQQAQ